MSFPKFGDATQQPLHVLFPEQYEASKRTIARDLALLGSMVVCAVLAVVLVAASVGA